MEGDAPEALPHQSDQQSWYICRKCRAMPLSVENVCCRKRLCVTTQDFFQSAVLDMNVLFIAIVNRSNVFLLMIRITVHQDITKQHTISGCFGSMGT